MLEVEVPVTRRPGRPTNAELSSRRLITVGEEQVELPPPRKWQPSDIDPWLLERINFRWPKPEAVWRGKLTGFANANDYLFITNDQAVLLAVTQQHEMSGEPVVREVFAFAREADFKSGAWGFSPGAAIGPMALKALYRHLREWSKAKAATRVYVGVCSDMVPSILKDAFSGYYVVGAAC